MKKAPYILLLTLFVILVFIVGVRYGQRVEKANKAIDYVLSLTPTGTPTVAPRTGFVSYSHQGCGINFIRPSYLKETESTTTSATLSDGTKDVISVSCVSSRTVTPQESKIATKEATFQGKKIIVTKQTIDKDVYVQFFIAHPLVNRKISVTIEESLYPLFERSLEFFSSTTKQ